MSIRKRLVAALVTLIAAPGFAGQMPKEAEAAYQAARTGYYALKRDEGRRKFRHNWLPVIKRFETVAAKFPKSDRAPDALFTAAQTLEELSRISRLDEDLSAAMADYQRLIDTAPRHKLADDAAYQLARIQLDRLARADEARKTASHALEIMPKGDRAKELKALIDSLPSDKKLAVKPTVKLVPADSDDAQESGEPSDGNKLALVAAIEKLARSKGPIGEYNSRNGADARQSAASDGKGIAADDSKDGAYAQKGSEDGRAGDSAGLLAQGSNESRSGDSRTGSVLGKKGADDGRTGDSHSGQVAMAAKQGSGDSRAGDSRKGSDASSGDSSSGDSRKGADATLAKNGSGDSSSGDSRKASDATVAKNGSDDSRSADSRKGSDSMLAKNGSEDARSGGVKLGSNASDSRKGSDEGRAVDAVIAKQGSNDARSGDSRKGTDGMMGSGDSRKDSDSSNDSVQLASARKISDSRPPSVEGVDARVAKARLKGLKGDADITLAEQLGLKVRRVVIDPGHGGHDSGAVGPSGSEEKDVSLAISKKLAKELQKAGFEVMLTRDDDTFVRLEDRANMANDARGDLFISIHCNSATTKKLHGIEVYTLNTSADRYSIRLAARENASSEKSISDLQFILADLATKANTEESSNLANRVQHSLVGRLSGKYKDVKDLGHKQALFYVLLGTRMPAILVETSFLSNPEEEKRLGSGEYQDQVAAAIAQGVQEFVGNRDRLAKVD